MSKGMKLLIGIGGAVIAVMLLVLAFFLWFFSADETKTTTTPTPTAGVVTSTPIPNVEPDEDKTDDVQENLPATDKKDETGDASEEVQPTETPDEPADTPVVPNDEADSKEDVGEITEPEEVTPTTVPEDTEVPDAEEVTPIPTVTVTPTASVTPTVTPTPTATPTPTVTPTPKPNVKYEREVKMGDNVWYRLTEDGILYVTGTGATWGYDAYIDEDNYIRGDYSGLNVMFQLLGTKHIVIEEGITKLGAWSLSKLAGAESITFPSTLREIEDYCFNGTGKSVNTVWIGLDKTKVKLSDKAFYGAVYQTEEDLRKPTPTPTLAPTPTSYPITADSLYQALVAEAGIKTNKNDSEPYSAALIREGILESNEVKKADEKLANQEAALLLYRAALKYNCKNDAQVVANAKKYDRISDKKSIVSKYEEAVYFCFGNGIMPGTSDGEYSHTRSFNAKNTILEADAVLYCKRLFDEDLRVPMSPDAQVIRTTNLPVQAKLYPYILESFPNVYYDTNYLYMYNLELDDRAYPECPGVVGFMERWCTPSTVEEFSKKQPERCKIYTSTTDYLGSEKVGLSTVVERYRDTWEQQAKRYLELVFNFDYRTVRSDTAWQKEIKNLSAFYTEWEKGTNWGSFAGVTGINDWMNNFLDSAEQNHTIVECSNIDFDMSTLFYSERFDTTAPYTIRVHLRYKISTDLEPDIYDRAELIPSRFRGTDGQYTSFGEWKDVYAELTFGTNSFDRTGIAGVRILEYNVDDAIRYHFDPKKYTK